MGRKTYPATGSLAIGDVLMSTSTTLPSKTWVPAQGGYFSYANYAQYWTFLNPSYDGSPIVMTKGASPESNTARGRIASLSETEYVVMYSVYTGSNSADMKIRVVNDAGTTLAERVLYSYNDYGGVESGYNLSSVISFAWWDPKNLVLHMQGAGGTYDYNYSKYIKFFKVSGAWTIAYNAFSTELGAYASGDVRQYSHPLNSNAVLEFSKYTNNYLNINVRVGVVDLKTPATSLSLTYATSGNVFYDGWYPWEFGFNAFIYYDPVTALYWGKSVATRAISNTTLLAWGLLNADLTVTTATPPNEGRLVAQPLTPLRVESRLRTDPMVLAGTGSLVMDIPNNRYFRMDDAKNVTCYQYDTNGRLAQYDTKIYPYSFDNKKTVYVGTAAAGYFLMMNEETLRTSASLWAGINKNTTPNKITFQVPTLSFTGVSTYVKAAG